MRLSYEKLKTNEKSIFFFSEFMQHRLESPFHYHDEYEMIYMKKANGKLFVGNHVINFDNNELYLFAPGLAHCFYNSTRNEAKKEMAHGYLFQFETDFLGSEFIDKEETSQLKKLFEKAKYGIQITDPSQSLVDKIINLKDCNGIQRLANLLLIFGDVMAHKYKLLTTQITSAINTPTDSKNILDVYKYVEDNFQNDISFSDAASVANMQNAAFCRYFKRKALKKFSTYVNEVRISHAQKLLAETDKPTSEICFDCGFNNLTYFNKQFKIFFKMSPLQYRKLWERSNLDE
jgi:AraC-like DNA-binding protein